MGLVNALRRAAFVVGDAEKIGAYRANGFRRASLRLFVAPRIKKPPSTEVDGGRNREEADHNIAEGKGRCN
jgi:hypothetical protein